MRVVFLCVALAGCCLADPTSFDCPMRELALEFAESINPTLSERQLQEIADALNGAEEAQDCNVSSSGVSKGSYSNPIHSDPTVSHIDFNLAQNILNNDDIPAIYVDNSIGIDAMDVAQRGWRIETPLKSIQYAIQLSRSYKNSSQLDGKWLKILIREGNYFIDAKNPIILSEHDSFLMISSFNNEAVTLTGAKNISCDWSLYGSVSNSTDKIYKCSLDASKFNLTAHGRNPVVPGLRINGGRAIRARYPNANPETDGFGSELSPLEYLGSTLPSRADEDFVPEAPFRNTSSFDYFQKYALGVGGNCENFYPPAGYWCSSSCEGGGAAAYYLTSGLTYDSTILPNSPYKDLTGAIVQCWRTAHWASWMFEVNNETSTDSTLYFSYGGFQGARGSKGEEFFIENVMEELDYPTEFFYDEKNANLYFVTNGSNDSSNAFKDIDDIKFEVTQTKTLMLVQNAHSVVVNGLIVRDTAYTYMDPHGMPSGGDWALGYTGSVILTNSKNVTICNNNFTRLDGNGIFLYGYNENVTINNNEFKWLGETAIALWGQTYGVNFDNDELFGTTMSMGPYETDYTKDYDQQETQPHNVNVVQNYCHELGIFEKQASFYFQAKSFSNIIAYNIFYNGPRAGINFNDGFAGGSKVYKNLLFNTCKESSDHGPFNSWDRQVYSFNNGQVSKQYDEIYSNFLISNYGGLYGVDNDDGSNFYQTYGNFMVYGENGLKSNFGGHNNWHMNNIYAYMTLTCWKQHDTQPAANSEYINKFVNNTCVLNVTDVNQSAVMFQVASQTECTNVNWNTTDSDKKDTIFGIKLSGNQFWIPSATVDNIGVCNRSVATLQSEYGIEDGTVVYDTWPDDSALLSAAKTLLFT